MTVSRFVATAETDVAAPAERVWAALTQTGTRAAYMQGALVTTTWDPDEEPALAATSDQAENPDEFEVAHDEDEQHADGRRRGRRGGTRRRARSAS